MPPALVALGLIELGLAVHILGVALAGRAAGVVIEVTSLGIGPKLLSRRFRNIDWQIALLPFAAYVKFGGASEDEELGPGSFLLLPPWKRVLVSLSGVGALLVLAMLLLRPSRLFATYEGFLQPSRAVSVTALLGHDIPTAMGLVAAGMAALNLLPIPPLNGFVALTEALRSPGAKSRLPATVVSRLLLLAFVGWIVWDTLKRLH